MHTQEAKEALSKAKEATHRSYPTAVEAVCEASQKVSDMMCAKLLLAEKGFEVGVVKASELCLFDFSCWVRRLFHLLTCQMLVRSRSTFV